MALIISEPHSSRFSNLYKPSPCCSLKEVPTWLFFLSRSKSSGTCICSGILILNYNYKTSVFLVELANCEASVDVEDADSSNERLVLTLYDALASRDSETVVNILAPQLEWWFHGPPYHQFLMRLLTGRGRHTSFRFLPHSVASFGPTVLVEGCDTARSISWVHAWTVTHGIITHVREYFNTSLTVTRISDSQHREEEITPLSRGFPCVWQSTLSNRVGKSVPGLVLAI